MALDKIPYGLALMILRGVTADLDDAVKSKNITRIRLCIDRLQIAKQNFTSALNNFDKNSYVQRSYSMVEEESTIAADTTYQTAVSFVRGSLSLV